MIVTTGFGAQGDSFLKGKLFLGYVAVILFYTAMAHESKDSEYPLEAALHMVLVTFTVWLGLMNVSAHDTGLNRSIGLLLISGTLFTATMLAELLRQKLAGSVYTLIAKYLLRTTMYATFCSGLYFLVFGDWNKEPFAEALNW